MSFFSRSNNQLSPGRLGGSPINGLNRRACIEVNKVFDACRIQQIQKDVTFPLINCHPKSPCSPFTFIDGRHMYQRAIVTDVHIDRLVENPNFADVSCKVTIPLKFTFLDANNIGGTAESQIVVPVKTILFVPRESMTPTQIVADASCSCTDGHYVSSQNFVCNTCINIVLKEIALVELLVPTFGYAHIPCCTPSQGPCDQFFELPLFPQERS